MTMAFLELGVELLQSGPLLLGQDGLDPRVGLLAMLAESLAIATSLLAQLLELGVLLSEDSADLLGLFGGQIELLLEFGQVLLRVVSLHSILREARGRHEEQDREQPGPGDGPPDGVQANGVQANRVHGVPSWNAVQGRLGNGSGGPTRRVCYRLDTDGAGFIPSRNVRATAPQAFA
jgi:hypothetical protein